MTEQGLRLKQDQYNLQKYNQSTIARTDMSGKCDFCRDCMFKTETLNCVLDQETKDKYSVCARNGVKIEEADNARRKNTTSTKRRTSKKSSNL